MFNFGRRRAIAAIGSMAALAIRPGQPLADGARVIDAALARAEGEGANCGQRAASLAGTRARLASISLPDTGRLVLVNVASQTLTAYRDGEPEIEMRVVVGTPRTRTPDLLTEMDFVRLNPTWTVPASILREPGFRRNLADPTFVSRNGFVGGGGRWVQQPGPRNALGRVKFGLRNSGAIYLHDTNEPSKFDIDLRALSHGCIRLHDPFALAAWVLGTGRDEIEVRQRGGERRDIRDFSRVAVVVGYFTAFPDANGDLILHRDVYRRDPRPIPCPGGE